MYLFKIYLRYFWWSFFLQQVTFCFPADIFRRWYILIFGPWYGIGELSLFQLLSNILVYNNFISTKKDHFFMSKFESLTLLHSLFKSSLTEIHLAEDFVQKNCNFPYYNLFYSKLRHLYFSTYITKFSEQLPLKNLQEQTSFCQWYIKTCVKLGNIFLWKLHVYLKITIFFITM